MPVGVLGACATGEGQPAVLQVREDSDSWSAAPIIAHVDEAFAWVCRQRTGYCANSDIWDLRHHWHRERQRVCHELPAGQFRFQPLRAVTHATGETTHVWCARDALVLKALTQALSPRLPLSPHCFHLKGHGGLKGALRAVRARLPSYTFVLRTDVEGFYEHIDHEILIRLLAQDVPDPLVLDLLSQAIQRTVEHGGLYRDIRTGISRGCPLSPLLGACYLRTLDERLGGRKLFYARYMDDILVLTRTRGQLRRAVALLNQIFADLRVSKHPAKTFVGRIARGFDFLGHHFTLDRVMVASESMERFAERVLQLYEQGCREPARASALGKYVRRWLGWATGGWRGAPERTIDERWQRSVILSSVRAYGSGKNPTLQLPTP